MTAKQLQAMTMLSIDPRPTEADRRAEIDRLRDQAAARHSTLSPIDALRYLYGDEAVVRGMRKLLAGGRNQRGIE